MGLWTRVVMFGDHPERMKMEISLTHSREFSIHALRMALLTLEPLTQARETKAVVKHRTPNDSRDFLECGA